MSLDRSLKSQAALVRSRNVLTRAERLKTLADEERWDSNKSVFGLPKVRQRKSSAGKKSKSEASAPAAEAAATAGAGTAPPAAGAGATTPAAGATKGAATKGSAEGKGKK